MTAPLDDDLAARLAGTLAQDALAVRIIRLLGDIGVDALLLKGPAIARWLYAGEERSYEDCDLLVAPAAADAARALLSQNGYTRFLPPPPRANLAPPISESWTKGWEQIDLHVSFWGMRADPDEVWDALWTRRATLPLERGTVPTPDRAGLLVLIALHAAHHGLATPKPAEDLRRAVQQAPAEDWRAAWQLAERLGAATAMAAVLPAVPGGPGLAAALGLRRRPGWQTAAAAARLGEGLDRLMLARGPRAKAAVVVAEIAPSAAFMRWRYPVARRGRAGLALAYARRLGETLVSVARLAARRA